MRLWAEPMESPPSGEAAVQGLSAAQAALYAQVLDGRIGRLLRVPFVGLGLTSCESPG